MSMTTLPFIPKKNQDLPDAFTVTFHFLSGKDKAFEAASIRRSEQFYELVTKDDLWAVIPIANVDWIEFDKRYSKVVAIREKESRDQMINKEVERKQ